MGVKKDYLSPLYTLEDVLGLADGAYTNNLISYVKCASILEKKIELMFPWIKPEIFFSQVKERLSDKKGFSYMAYSYQLVRAGRKLGEVFNVSQKYLVTSRMSNN